MATQPSDRNCVPGYDARMPNEAIFTMDASSIKFGPGATREVGEDLRALGAQRVMVVTDPHLAALEPVAVTLESLRTAGIDAVLFDRARVEPTDVSFKEAIEFAQRGQLRRATSASAAARASTRPKPPICTPPTRPTSWPT